MKKTVMMIFLLALGASVSADAGPSNGNARREDKPRVAREAERRERARQDAEWTPENIRRYPELFLQDAIAQCDVLREKIEAQDIAFLRLKKQAERKGEEADFAIRRYSKFLEEAKKQYKIATGEGGSFPVKINGFELDEDELNDKVADALERVELAEKQKSTNEKIVRKVKIRQGVLKTKTRELRSIRRKLELQLEQVKMNKALGEIGTLTDILGTIKDMSVELAEDPTKFSLEDMTEGDSDASRKRSASDFLES